MTDIPATSESADIPKAGRAASAVRALFRDRFGGDPTVVASAPGRVNLIGEHLDYNGGEVLPMAIGQRTYVAARAVDGGTTTATSATQRDTGQFDASAPRPVGAWWDYVAGTAAELAKARVAVPQAELAVWSDVPTGAGLSSSAALEMAAGLAYLGLSDATRSFPLRELALLGQRVESGFVGVASGIMDQFASALSEAGQALHLWAATATYEHVPMRDVVLIFDTGVARSLRGSAFNDRQRECAEALELLRRIDPELPNLASATPELLAAAELPPPLGRRARHVVTEMRRVHETVAVLKSTGTIPGRLLHESHESLRTDFEASSPELDWFVEHAMARPGITGARLTGAGWGGCAIAVGAEPALADAAPALAREYSTTFQREPRTWVTHAAAGAALESAGESGSDTGAEPRGG